MIICAGDRPINHNHWSRLIVPTRGILKARSGAASTELAFVLGFVALIAGSGFVFLGGGFSDSYTDLSQQIQVATVNMPNPLGSGNVANNGSGGEESGGGSGSSGSNGGGNGNGNGNGNN